MQNSHPRQLTKKLYANKWLQRSSHVLIPNYWISNTGNIMIMTVCAGDCSTVEVFRRYTPRSATSCKFMATRRNLLHSAANRNGSD